jgi:hypothetical protein
VTYGCVCRCCGERHDELPFSYHAEAPDHWPGRRTRRSRLTGETCVIRGKSFFIRALVRLPVRDAAEDFAWGVWVSLSEANFRRTVALWETPGRETEPPMFGWFSTELPVYEPSTINLKTMVHMRPVGERPLLELEPTDHPLAVEQREGIDLARVRELADLVLHA